MTGWFSVHRKLKDSTVFSDPFILKLWLLCLMKVTYTEHDQIIGTQVVKLAPGEFVTGRYALAEEYNKGASPKNKVTAITVWRWLKLLEKMEMLNIKTSNKFSVVTVVNWQAYQNNEQQVNNKRTTDEQQMNTNNKGNKDNKGNKKPSPRKRVYEEGSDYYKLAAFMESEIRRNSPNMKDPDLQKWANEFRLLIEVDKKKVPSNEVKSEVSRLIRWVQQDSFEMANVLSPAKLRIRYDALIIKMNQNTKGATIYHMPTAKPEEYKHDINAGEN